jgi:2,3-bisphosphoglycerate-dependent phosphoglycerate mutase
MKSKLFLLRHGQSAWNQKNQFTGWVDIPLSAQGIQEAIAAGKELSEQPIDAIYTSTLVRAHMTLVLSMAEHSSGKIPSFQHTPGTRLADWAQVYSPETERELIPVHIAWELNERYYGKLQGLNKSEMAKKYGAEQVQNWRRSFATPPPEGESLEMTAKRTIPYFQKTILPVLEAGKNVLVVAHGNSLRSIAMHLERMTPEQVIHFEIPTGKFLTYTHRDQRWMRT